MDGRPCVFLDRDGTIIHHVPYLRSPEAVRLLPGAAEGIRCLRAAGWPCCLVTNQGGVALGRMTLEDVAAVNQRMRELLRAEGADLDGVAVCPHHPRGQVAPYGGPCACRKPGTLMVERLCLRHGLDARRSFFVGDSDVDIGCALGAGCTPLLVAPEPPATGGVRVVADLTAAARLILGSAAGLPG